MGNGLKFVCAECGEEYSVDYGIGFGFPRVYKKCIQALKKGKYGSEWKELFLSNKYAVIDAESYVYLCKKCGHWEVEEGLSLYVPKNPEKILKRIKEAGKDFYVMSDELKYNYRLLKRRIHKCSKCGKVMHKANSEEEFFLKCPKCGTKPRLGNVFPVYWD